MQKMFTMENGMGPQLLFTAIPGVMGTIVGIEGMMARGDRGVIDLQASRILFQIFAASVVSLGVGGLTAAKKISAQMGHDLTLSIMAIAFIVIWIVNDALPRIYNSEIQKYSTLITAIFACLHYACSRERLQNDQERKAI